MRHLDPLRQRRAGGLRRRPERALKRLLRDEGVQARLHNSNTNVSQPQNLMIAFFSEDMHTWSQKAVSFPPPNTFAGGYAPIVDQEQGTTLQNYSSEAACHLVFTATALLVH